MSDKGNETAPSSEPSLAEALQALDPFNTIPEARNAEGVEFWSDVELTHYARETKGLKEMRVLLVRTPEGERTRLAVWMGTPLKESTSLEGMAIWLDAFALANATPATGPDVAPDGG